MYPQAKRKDEDVKGYANINEVAFVENSGGACYGLVLNPMTNLKTIYDAPARKQRASASRRVFNYSYHAGMLYTSTGHL